MSQKSELIPRVAPGTDLRQGIENVRMANTGGLVVIGYGEMAQSLIHGGFELNHPFSPESLYELAKMDGAIVLSADAKFILLANAQLNPDVFIPTKETGTRHRAAERFAIQTGELVVSISKRRNTVTLCKGKFRYVLPNIENIFSKTNQALQRLEKLKSSFDAELKKLTYMELNRLVSLQDALQVLSLSQRMMILKHELASYATELGVEGNMLEMQIREINFERQVPLLFRDYIRPDSDIKAEDLFHEFEVVSKRSNEPIKEASIAKMMGYPSHINPSDEHPNVYGFRILNKIHRLPSSVIENLVEQLGGLRELLDVPMDELNEVEGIGEIRAQRIKEWLEVNKKRDF